MKEEVVSLLNDLKEYSRDIFNCAVSPHGADFKDTPKEEHPSSLPVYAEKLERVLDDALPFFLDRYMAIDDTGISEDSITRYIKIIALSAAMGATDVFLPHRIAMRNSFGFMDNKAEKEAVRALTSNLIIKGIGVPFKMVKTSFNPIERPKADNPKQDPALQLGIRLFLYSTALWHGATKEQAKTIYDRHMVASWARVMCGDYEEALNLLNKR